MTAMHGWGGVTILTGILCQFPLAGQSPTATAAAERALLDQYCVVCHNDKTKIANFSLQKAGHQRGRRSSGSLGAGHPQAARGHDAAARHAPAAAGEV